ncbi:hypothetical protein [Nonomuraea sp. NPDC046570]|uniref:hypothetical protein n=1 Tax=Nonomuraea sp. NPDC046570 TaxID=3155255 RepID=UPI0033E4104A
MITATADVQAAFTAAAQISGLLREPEKDLAARRAKLASETRKSLIESAVPRGDTSTSRTAAKAPMELPLQ